MTSEYYDEAQEAFTHALKIKTFNEKDDNYYFIDDWMYMGFNKEGSKFKNKFTKEYIYVEKGPRYHGWAKEENGPKDGGFLSE